MLAGVEDEQQLTVAQVVHDGVRLGPGFLLRQPETARHGVRQQPGIAEPSEFGQEDAVGEAGAGAERGAQRHPRLAHPAGPGHGDQPGGPQQAVENG